MDARWCCSMDARCSGTNIIPHVFGRWTFCRPIHEYSGNSFQRRILEKRNSETCKGTRRSPTYLDKLGAKSPRRHPRSTQQLTRGRRRGAAPPGCGCTLGVPTALPLPNGPSFLKWYNKCSPRRFCMVSPGIFIANHRSEQYKRRERAPSLSHTSFGATTPHTSLLYSLLHFSCLLRARQNYLGGLDSLEVILGMNNMMSSSKVLFSYYQYSYAYELEYSFHVMILTYELAYSFYVMNLTCRTLCLIIHITYMIRIRTKLRWWFIVPLCLTMSYACRSIGSESQGGYGNFLCRSFFVHRRDAQVHGYLWKWWCSMVER